MSVFLARNFTWEEFRCRCGCGIEEDYFEEIKLLAQKLQALRNDINLDPELYKYRHINRGDFRIIILSGIRCLKRNRSEGGVKDSRHLPKHYDAVDFTCPELPTEILFKKAKKYFNVCIYYRGRYFIHGDLRPGEKKSWVKAPNKTLEPTRA